MFPISWEVQLRFVLRHAVRYFWLPHGCFVFFASFHLFCWSTCSVVVIEVIISYPISQMPTRILTLTMWNRGWKQDGESQGLSCLSALLNSDSSTPSRSGTRRMGRASISPEQVLLLLLLASHSYPAPPQTQRGCSVNACFTLCCAASSSSSFSSDLAAVFLLFWTPFHLSERVWFFCLFLNIFSRGASSLAAGLSCSLWWVI